METTNLYQYPAETVAEKLSTNIHTGLSENEARKRLEQNGLNQFNKTKHTSLLVKFLNQFKSFMILVLFVAAAVSGIVGHMNNEGFTDTIVILCIVVLNAIIGVIQEAKAEKSLDALEKLSSPSSNVIRDGQVKTIPSAELVAGDIVLIETGDAIPADLRLTEAVNLRCDESALTGESLPAEKDTLPVEGIVGPGDQHNMAFSSTNVTYGRGKGIVTSTGMHTEVGKIASMLQSVRATRTPMQEKLDKLGKTLAIMALSICGLIFLVGILYGRDWIEMFMTAVSLAVAAIPEGLPAISTIVLALGVQRLVKKNAIVRKLPSVETLGSTQVICSDKTGTLTQNRMSIIQFFLNGTVSKVSDIAGSEERDIELLVKLSLLANDAKLRLEEETWTALGDPTETAMLDLGLKLGHHKHKIDDDHPRVSEIPFDSERKMMTTAHARNEDFLIAAKGGPEEILARCDRIYEHGKFRPLSDSDRTRIKEANVRMAGQALRVLAVAMNEIDIHPDTVEGSNWESGLVFVGMFGMMDPPREEVKAAVAKCRTAGIKPVMITGDHKITAIAIARELGIMEEVDKAVTGAELSELSDEQLRKEIHSISVYARVAPEDKMRIVRAFQDDGRIVAMTGDGVNDAPALKLADIGIAMGITGTDVSKEAADVVLTDDNFATIVSAVEEGRRIYDNILKAIQFLLSTNIGEVLVLFIAVMLNWDAPLLPIHILWINLVTDSLPALALSIDPAAHGIMERPPIDSRTGIMTRRFTTRILLRGGLIGGLSLWAYHIGLQAGIEQARTMTFAVVVFSQISLLYGVRSDEDSAFRNIFSNKYLTGALLIVIALMLAVMEIPALHAPFHITTLDRFQWIWIVLLSLLPLFITDLTKIAVRAFKRKNKKNV